MPFGKMLLGLSVVALCTMFAAAQKKSCCSGYSTQRSLHRDKKVGR